MNKEIDSYIRDSEDAIFHYTKLSVGIEKILFERRIHLSLVKDTNDPREYSYRTFYAVGSRMPDDFSKLYSQVLDELDRLLRFQSRIVCFCSNRRPRILVNDHKTKEDADSIVGGWAKSRMWSQYAEGHTGLCLVFSKKAIEEQMQSVSEFYRIDQVRYGPPEAISAQGMTINGNTLSQQGVKDYSINHLRATYESLLFLKNIDYRDEAECRLFVFDPMSAFEYMDISKSLKAVVIGDRTPEVYLPLIKSQCADLGVRYRKVIWSNATPLLVGW